MPALAVVALAAVLLGRSHRILRIAFDLVVCTAVFGGFATFLLHV